MSLYSGKQKFQPQAGDQAASSLARLTRPPPGYSAGVGPHLFLLPSEETARGRDESLASQQGKDARPTAEVTATSPVLLKGATIKVFDFVKKKKSYIRKDHAYCCEFHV